MNHLIAAALVLLASLFAAPANASSQPGLSLSGFRVSQYSVFEAKGGNSFAAWAGWTPTYMMGSTLGLRLSAGVGGMKPGTNSTDFVYLIGTAEGLAVLQLSESLALEAGPGMQIWVLGAKSKILSATGGLVYSLASPLWFIKGIALDYTAAFQTNNLSQQIRVGAVF